MYVKHLQEYLDKFTRGRGDRRGNAISHAKVFIYVNGHLEEIKRIEVHESPADPKNPLDASGRVVLKPQREEKLILPQGYIRDY